MKLQVLRYVIAVADHRSFSRAAQALFVTQPTLSRQIRELERELGCQLFDRSGHEVALTDAGAFLHQRAQEIVGLADRTARDLSNRSLEVVGTIVVGSTETRGFHTFAKQVQRFSQRHPLVTFELHTGYTDDMEARLARGAIDIGVLMTNVDTTGLGYVRLPERNRWGVLVRADDELARSPAVTVEALAARPLIMPRRAVARNDVMNWFGAHAEGIRTVATYSLLSNAALLVEHGVGTCVCLDGAVGAQDSAACRFVPLAPAHEQGSIVAWRRDRPASAPVQAFIAQLMEELGA